MSSQKEYCVAGELAEKLEIIAAEVASSPEELLRSIVSQFVGRHTGFADSDSERRAFERVDISIPAMLYVEEDGGASVRYQPASIRDVSPGGMRVVCTGSSLCGRLISDFSADFEFEVIFSFSEEMKPVRFRCRAARIEVLEEELHIGARIVGSDAEGQALYQRIVNSDLCGPSQENRN